MDRKLGSRGLQERSDDPHSKAALSVRVKVARQSSPLVAYRNQGGILARGCEVNGDGAGDVPRVGVLGCIRDQFADKERNEHSTIGSHANFTGRLKVDGAGQDQLRSGRGRHR